MTMKALRLYLVLGSLLLVSGCASVHRQAENVFPDPAPEQGLVYFLRERKFVGSAVTYDVRHNDEVIGALADGTYFFYFVDPGTQTFTASTEDSSSRTIDVEAGETYYIKGSLDTGFLVGQPALEIVHEMEGKSVLPGLVYAIKKPSRKNAEAVEASDSR
jgi:hypothetical protein